MPTPTAAPCIAAIVGFEQWCMAREVLPPLLYVSLNALLAWVYFLPIPVIHIPFNLGVLHLPGLVFGAQKSNLQVSSCAEASSCSSQDDYLDTLININELVDTLEVFSHLVREGIVFLRSVQCDQENLCGGR